jgi:hypothetical protein
MRAYAYVPFLLSLCGCVVEQPAPIPASSSAPQTMVRTIVSGERQRIDFYVALNPDCTPQGYVTVRIVTPPVHGELTTERGVDYPNYPKANQRYQCNLTKSPLINVYYKSNPGYVGADSATIEWDSPMIAVTRTTTYTITVR